MLLVGRKTTKRAVILLLAATGLAAQPIAFSSAGST